VKVGHYQPNAADAALQAKPGSSDLTMPGTPGLVVHPVKHRRDKTTALSTTRHRTVQLNFPLKQVPTDALGNHLQQNFVAFLPLEIFAHKLRGFVEDLGAETLRVDPERTVLRFRPSGLLTGRRAVFLQLDTCTRNPATGYRGVEATVWTADGGMSVDELNRRGHLLIRYLKAHLMAVDREPLWGQLTSAQVRRVIFE
jgi:hypothetical protein